MPRSPSPSPEPELPTLSIGELAARAGVRTSAIRYYESVGLLPPAARAGRYRRFPPNTVQLIATLRFAQRAGFTVSEIRTLFHGFGAEVPPAERWRVLAEQKVSELDALIADAQRMQHALQEGMRCGCLRVENCVIDGDAGCGLPGPAAAASPVTLALGRGARRPDAAKSRPAVSPTT
ncbi:MAG TPA: MerR family transcriptional regulator [Gemmatimonadaceae bacterium]|nr:MerR family transcriptional regulator [Gemmatimonadaceae bacterium]